MEPGVLQNDYTTVIKRYAFFLILSLNMQMSYKNLTFFSISLYFSHSEAEIEACMEKRKVI